ncbi:glycosyltransferase [Cohnella zeiphila]|uniref:Glycosyltransferase n=1 Tax=Cohnella zeiphila TaxID=2761120 RepID=A0A7X0SQX6_9BACL|nr:glycosyltransferase [Cohnella zeiphila]MBB6734525.1 glycosyltransferase [Cohnella zeiphila]
MYSKEQRRLLRMLNGVVRWKKNKRQARLQKARLLRKIEYWRRTRAKSRTRIAPAHSIPVLQEGKDPALPELATPSFDLSSSTSESTASEVPSSPASVRSFDLFRFPIIDWGYRWQRPQHMSRHFAQDGIRVFYFSVHSTQIEDPNATSDDIRSKLQIEQVEPNVWLVKLCSHTLLNAYVHTIEDPLDKQYLQWSIEALKQKFGIDYTVSIVDLPFWTALVFELKNNKTIYDCMDEHSGFSNTSEELLALEPKLLASADAVVVSSVHLQEKAKKWNRRVEWIPNAGEYKHFSRHFHDAPNDMPSVNGPIIGYFGAIADWFDIDLIYQVASANRDWSFVLIGNSYHTDVAKLMSLENVYLLGEKPYQELPRYLDRFDVCIIPFLINKLTKATNPVKVYEYLAAGKPVVATDLQELHGMKEYVELAADSSEFETSIRRVLQEKNDPTLADKRQQFAAENTWEKRYLQLKKLIRTKLYPKVSIIVVTHNNWELSERCMDSVLRKTDYPDYEVIVVDNGSLDETPASLLQLNHPKVKTILLPKNGGYAQGNTIGAFNAVGDILVLLNNDTLVSEGWLNRLLHPFSLDPEIGAVGPMSNSVGNDQHVDFFIGDSTNGANENWLRDFYELYDGKMRYTEMLGFFCVAIKKEVFAKIGYLDDRFGAGMFEDDDYCLRMLAGGYRLAIAEDAFVYHYGSATFKQWDEHHYDETFKNNKKIFEEKWQREWKQHKMPASPFLHLADRDRIAEIIAESGQPAVLVYISKDWSELHSIWKRRLIELNQNQTMVFVRCSTYLQKPVHGIRRIGPNLYLTNDDNLLKKARFAHIYTFTEYRREANDNAG